MTKKPKAVDPRDVYRHALRFLATDGYLRTNASTDPKLAYWAQHPAMVISSLASELMLKCLLILDGKSDQAYGHNLRDLFGRLNQDKQNRITQLWDLDQSKRKADVDRNEQKMGVTIPRDLPTALSDCGDAFVLLRYLYEDPMKATFYITFFPIVLRDFIRELTGWDD